jgi:hypothetical protein
MGEENTPEGPETAGFATDTSHDAIIGYGLLRDS